MKRSEGIDIIKVLATFFVVAVHFFLNTGYYSINLVLGRNLFFQTFFRWFFVICVPLFLIITGYLQNKKQISKRYYKGLIYVVAIYILYSVLTIFVRVHFFGEKQSIINWISDTIYFKVGGYTWYINMYIGLFLMVPFLNLIFNNLKNKKEKRILLITFSILTGLPGLFNYMPILFYGTKLILFPEWWINIWPVTYYFIGCYIYEFRPSLNKVLAVFLLVCIVVVETILTFYFSFGSKFAGVIGDYTSISVMIVAFLFFIIFYDIEIKSSIVCKGISLIASLSLDIYLSSFMVDRFIYRYVMSHVFKSNYQIIYYFIPIVGSIIIFTTIVGLLRKVIGSFLFYLFNKIYPNVLNNQKIHRILTKKF